MQCQNFDFNLRRDRQKKKKNPMSVVRRNEHILGYVVKKYKKKKKSGIKGLKCSQ